MPIYEYKCPDCGHAFDAIQKMSDDPIKVCPSCGAGQVKKLISATSFVLKGSGWYKDHYGLKKGGDGGGDGGESKPSVAAAKTDATPAAAPAAAAPAAPSSSSSSSGSSTPASG